MKIRIAATLSSLVLVAGMAAACGGDGGSPSAEGEKAAGGMIARLNMGDFGGGNAPQRNFNPYLLATKLATEYTFEPLFMINRYSCEITPWLGSSYEWETPSKLVVKTRPGIKWSDGQAFSAKDVAFTFNLFKKAPALDTNGLWTKLASVTADSDEQVTFAFKAPSVPTLNQIVDVAIVPEHIWSKEADPTKFTNPNPVGTGPFKVKSMNSQQLVLERNPQYWQADKVKIRELFFKKATGSSEVDKLRLARGEYDWNAMFVPDIDKTFVAKDPKNNHYWFPPGGNIALSMNLTRAPFDDLQFRKAMTYAIDREEIKNKAQFGYVETASQTSLVLPGQKEWLPAGLENDGKIAYDADKAKKTLADAGYKTNAEGKLLGKDGKPMTFSFMVPNGWVDWIQAAQIVQKNLAALGITIDLQTPQYEKTDADAKVGNFQMMFGVHGGDCNIYQSFQHPFGSSQTAPIGKQAATNYIRFKDAKTDQLLDQLVQAVDENQQKTLVQQLAMRMYEEVPDVPLWYGAKWFQYRTEKAIGWPNEKDPYGGPDNQLLIVTKLRPNPDYKG